MGCVATVQAKAEAKKNDDKKKEEAKKTTDAKKEETKKTEAKKEESKNGEKITESKTRKVTKKKEIKKDENGQEVEYEVEVIEETVVQNIESNNEAQVSSAAPGGAIIGVDVAKYKLNECDKGDFFFEAPCKGTRNAEDGTPSDMGITSLRFGDAGKINGKGKCAEGEYTLRGRLAKEGGVFIELNYTGKGQAYFEGKMDDRCIKGTYKTSEKTGNFAIELGLNWMEQLTNLIGVNSEKKGALFLDDDNKEWFVAQISAPDEKKLCKVILYLVGGTKKDATLDVSADTSITLIIGEKEFLFMLNV
jgi:hypothetical protein